MADKKEQLIQIIDENNRLGTEVIQQKINIWTEHVLFTWQWWLGVAFSIGPWVLWFIFRKKQCTDRSLYIGLRIPEKISHLFRKTLVTDSGNV